MRKLGFLLIVFVLFVGCDDKSHQIVNDSDYEVTVILNCYAQCKHILNAHTSIEIKEKLDIKSYSATPPRISYTNDNETLTFFNTPARQIKIVNGIDKNILITALGCMDNEPVLVPANGDFTNDIYSNNPTFSGMTIEGFPVKFTFSLDKQSVMVHW